MAPARVDRVASFNAAAGRRRLRPPPTRIFAGARKGIARRAAPDRRRRRGAAPSGAWPTCATSARAARSPWRCRRRSAKPACARRSRRPTRRCSPARRRAPPSSSWRCASRSARRCRAPAASSNCRAMPRPTALKGTRPVFFPDAGKTLQTQVWDRYALAARRADRRARRCSRKTRAPSSSAPARTARLLADGSILAEVELMALVAQSKNEGVFDARSSSSSAVAAADLRLVDEAAAAHGAHQLLDPGARELRLLLRHHRRRPASRWCRRRRASRASSARCRRR